MHLDTAQAIATMLALLHCEPNCGRKTIGKIAAWIGGEGK